MFALAWEYSLQFQLHLLKNFPQAETCKNYLRSAMSQTRLVDLATLNIESSIARQVDFDSVIRNFVNKNTRKSLI